MKVLLINNFHFPKGGADAVYLNTGKMLTNEDIEVIFFSTKNEMNIIDGQNDFFVDSYHPRLIKFARYFYSSEVYRKLKQLILAEKPDIAHVHIFYGQLTNAVIKALKELSIPIVMSVHDYRILCPVSIMLNNNKEICEKCAGGKYYNSVLDRCNKGSFLTSIVSALESYYRDIFFDYKKHVSHFIMVSEFIKSKHIDYYPFLKNKSSVLYNFKDFQKVSLNKTKNNHLIYFGRLSKEKGILTLLNALQKTPQIILKIAGTGPFKKNIEEFIKNNNMTNIILLGYCSGEDLWSHVKTSKFSIITSEWYENNPMSVIESLHLGTPVIGAKIGGIPEIVKSQHGFLFNSGSVEDLKRTIERSFALNNDKYRQMQLNGLRFAQEKFSKKTHFNSLISIYNNAIQNKP